MTRSREGEHDEDSEDDREATPLSSMAKDLVAGELACAMRMLLCFYVRFRGTRRVLGTLRVWGWVLIFPVIGFGAGSGFVVGSRVWVRECSTRPVAILSCNLFYHKIKINFYVFCPSMKNRIS